MINRYDREMEIILALNKAEGDYNFKIGIARLITELELKIERIETEFGGWEDE